MGLDIWNLMSLRYPAGTVLCTPKHSSPLFLITKPQTISLQKVYPGKVLPTRKRAPGPFSNLVTFIRTLSHPRLMVLKTFFFFMCSSTQKEPREIMAVQWGYKRSLFPQQHQTHLVKKMPKMLCFAWLGIKDRALSSLHSKSLIGWRSRMYTNQPGMGRTSLFPMMLCT